MNKVVKLALICDQYDKDGNYVEHSKIYHILWDLQKQTREIKNKTIQYCWEYYNFSSDYYKQFNKHPKEKDILSSYSTLEGYINDRIKNGNDLYSGNCSTTMRIACAEFKNSKAEFKEGSKSIINYKANQPLEIHNKAISITFSDKTFYADLSLLKNEVRKKYNFKRCSIHFKIDVRDNSTQTILERCIDNIYKISASKLIYNKKKKQWFLYLSYSFENIVVKNLDSQKILGVDLGIHYPLCASVYGDWNRFTIDGGEIEKFRKKVEARKYSMLKQGKNCGDGRIGHGIHTRNRPVYNIEDKIARFRDTANHKYSRELINYALKNNCGIIQMEDLTGITDCANRFLKNWSYYDLQTKIEYKAEEVGIKVVYIKPRYTSQRCSRCGYIDKENRLSQATFHCTNCGFKANADYNASQNIGILHIDNIIENDTKKKCESQAT